jgi:hypothetical protein
MLELTLPEGRILADLWSILADMNHVKGCFERLLTVHDDAHLNQALFGSALITYRRCTNTGMRNRLQKAEICAMAPGADEMHVYLYGLADKLIAHSVNPFEQIKTAFVKEGSTIGIGPVNMRFITSSRDGTTQMLAFVSQIIDTIIQPRIDAAQETATRIIESFSPEQVREFPEMVFRAPSPKDVAKHRK